MRFRDFLRGYGSLFTLFPTDHNEMTYFKISTLSDKEALSEDWKIVGNDLYDAVESVLHEKKNT